MRVWLAAFLLLLTLPGCTTPGASDPCGDGAGLGAPLPSETPERFDALADRLASIFGDRIVAWEEKGLRVDIPPAHFRTELGYIGAPMLTTPDDMVEGAMIRYLLETDAYREDAERSLQQVITQLAAPGWDVQMGLFSETATVVHVLDGAHVDGGLAKGTYKGLELHIGPWPDLSDAELLNGTDVEALVAAYVTCTLDDRGLTDAVELRDLQWSADWYGGSGDFHIVGEADGHGPRAYASVALTPWDIEGCAHTTFDVGIDLQTGHRWTDDDSLLRCVSGAPSADPGCQETYRAATPVTAHLEGTVEQVARRVLAAQDDSLISTRSHDSGITFAGQYGSLSIEHKEDLPIQADAPYEERMVMRYFADGRVGTLRAWQFLDALDRHFDAGTVEDMGVYEFRIAHPTLDHANPTYAWSSAVGDQFVLGNIWSLDEPEKILAEADLISAARSAAQCFDPAMKLHAAWPAALDGHAVYVATFSTNDFADQHWTLWAIADDLNSDHCRAELLLKLDPSNASWGVWNDGPARCGW